MEENNLRKIRLEKLERLKKLGIDPYPASSNKKQTIAQCLQIEGKVVSTAGRLFSLREHGNIAFADLKDETGRIQIFFQKKLLGDSFKELKLLDIGDFIQVEGEVIRTTAGEISIAPTAYKLLAKSLRPLPSEWYGFKDEELRFRKRYLDLLMHPELRDLFKKKTIFWQSMRNYLVNKGFLEVETPVLQPIPGGADARPFVTDHYAHDMKMYLRISLELPLKRLLVGGFEKVFEIGRIFRNEGISDEHLQDYTQLEFYWAYADYNDLMDLWQEMYQTVIKETFGTLTTKWKEHEIQWEGNWPRIEYTQLLNEHWGVKTEHMTIADLYTLAKKLSVAVEPNLGKGRLLDYIYKKTIRPNLIQPMFVMNHPVEVEPLAKRLESNPNNVQRTQLLAMGSELGKGFSELNDPIDQYERFQEQQSLRDAGDEEAQMMDEDYVEALEYGMPPAAGFGVSERLFAMLVDKPVREMVFFPTMKPQEDGGSKNSTFAKATVDKQEGKEKVSSKKSSFSKLTVDKQDFSRKMVIVVNRELPQWQVLNTVSHVSAYLGNKMETAFDTGESFDTKDTVKHPRNTQYPIVALVAKPGQLQNLAKKARESGILYHGFIREMIETTDDTEIANILAHKTEDQVEYLGVGVFGDNKDVDRLTKSYSLWGAKETVSSLPKKAESRMTREESYKLLLTHMTNKNLIKHSLAAEATMRALAKHFGEDEEMWGITGLLHDVDYELAQKEDKLDKHGILLFEKNPDFIPEPMAHAIKSHNYTHTNVMPESKMDWAITCCDQLTGITVAAALIHPDRKLASIDGKFVLKRFNMKSFAKGASREIIALCEEKLGIPLPEFIDITLKAMQGIHEELGL